MTKTLEYYVNWEKVSVVVDMTDDEIVWARILALKVLVANWTATEEEKKELELLK